MTKPRIPDNWKSQLATASGLSLQYICDMAVRRRQPSAAVACRLTNACRALKLPARLEDWVDVRASASPLFDVV